DLGILLDRRAADVRDEPRLREVELGKDVAHDVVDARVLEADRVQHPRRRLPNAVRGIAESRRERRALQHNRGDVGIGEALYPGVLLAEADAARQQHDRRVELDPAESEREPARALLERRGVVRHAGFRLRANYPRAPPRTPLAAPRCVARRAETP